MYCLKSLLLAVVLLLLLLTPAGAQAPGSSPTATTPSETDARIASFNDPHMSWVPTTSQRKQLLVFLPGTFGKPRERFPLAETAAALGYHVISLMYPDDVAAQVACSKSDNPDAHMTFRLALIQGGNYGDMRISQADSIENRLTKLLIYLTAKQPNSGWEQYLDKDKKIDWQKIAVSGHSQGGGHAYVISKFHKVARVITFGSPKDYSFYFNRPAKGFDSDTRTPLDRYFAFNHVKDPKGPYAREVEILQQIGLTKLGVAMVDNTVNYNHAHVLFTDVPINGSNPNLYHGSVLNADLPVCLPVWRYMLSEPVQ